MTVRPPGSAYCRRTVVAIDLFDGVASLGAALRKQSRFALWPASRAKEEAMVASEKEAEWRGVEWRDGRLRVKVKVPLIDYELKLPEL